MEKFIVANHTALRIADTAKGNPTIVLLHGYLESLNIWDSFTTLLAPEYRVIALDIPGHGISEVKGEIHTMEFLADTVKSVLDSAGVEKYVLVGHSMGGYVAEAFAEKYPEYLLGLVLFHSTPNPDGEEKKENRQREIDLIRQGKKELLAAVAGSKGFAAENRKKFREQIEELEEQISLTDDDGIIALLRGLIDRKDMNEMMRKLRVPQLFIFGKKDEYISVEAAETVAGNHPQAQIAWLENSGHMGFIEEAERSAEILREFIRTIA